MPSEVLQERDAKRTRGLNDEVVRQREATTAVGSRACIFVGDIFHVEVHLETLVLHTEARVPDPVAGQWHSVRVDAVTFILVIALEDAIPTLVNGLGVLRISCSCESGDVRQSVAIIGDPGYGGGEARVGIGAAGSDR